MPEYVNDIDKILTILAKKYFYTIIFLRQLKILAGLPIDNRDFCFYALGPFFKEILGVCYEKNQCKQ